MKKSTILGLTLLGALALSACVKGGNESSSINGESNSASSLVSESTSTLTGWSAEEKAIITSFFYGIDIPYFEVEGSGTLAYEESTNSAYKMGGTSTPTLLAAYAALFDNTWVDNSSITPEDVAEYGYCYAFLKEIKTQEGSRFAYVSFGAVVEDADGYLGFSEDGNGTFYLSITDPYVYEWPSDVVDYYTRDYFDVEEKVPAFTGADYYEIDESYTIFGILSIYAYTNDSTSLAKYKDILTKAGWHSEGLDDYGYEVFVSSDRELEVDIKYNTEYKSLDIDILAIEEEEDVPGTDIGPENPLGGTDNLTIDSFGVDKSANGYVDCNFRSNKTGAYYTGYLYPSNGIQLKSKDNSSGIVSTLSGGTLVSVSVSWNSTTASKASQTTADKAALNVQLFASNTPFTIEDMYNGKVSKVGDINYRNGQSSYTFTSSYKYIGIRSELGAVNLDSITIVWNA